VVGAVTSTILDERRPLGLAAAYWLDHRFIDLVATGPSRRAYTDAYLGPIG
jgi:hypothetical protein